MRTSLKQMNDRIEILLATYNGERYLAEQLDSILAQTHQNWHILARDDGSSDDTVAILSAYKTSLGEKLTIFEDARGNLGSVGNFSCLMENSTAPFAAFCDQDDVWLPEKLAVGLQAVLELEKRWGAETPCLSFSDLEIVDQCLKQTAASFWAHEKIYPERANELSRVLTHNAVTGCTAVINRSLVERAAPIPKGAVVHDWWVAMTAAAFGHVMSVPQTTVKYRQHNGNEIGPRGYGAKVSANRLIAFIKTAGQNRPGYLGLYRQVIAFREKFDERLDPANRKVVERFIELPNTLFLKRAFVLLAQRYLPTGVMRSLPFMVFFNGNNLET
jgi:glycosyltransferase involved in cell wall biosynthesis